MPMATRPWPTQGYATACPIYSIPFEPVCLTSASIDGGFKYSDQFEACRGDMQRFAFALDRWGDCVLEELRTNYNLYLDRSKATLECLATSLPREEFRDSPVAPECPVVEVDIDRFHNLSSFDVPPLCIGKTEFFPRNGWRLESCTKDVVEYIQTMKRKIEDASWTVHEKARRAGDDATRKFNCYARRERFCY